MTKAYDTYGGWTGKTFEPSGFFRVEKDDRWWLVTPEGNAFLSFGINHLHPEHWRQDYNTEAWKKRLGIEDLRGPEFEPALNRWFLETCATYGFNTAGIHSEVRVITQPRPRIAYVQPIEFVDIPHWKTEVPDESFVDVFAPGFASHCDDLARRIAAPLRGDPWLFGYAMTDCPLFTEQDCQARPDTIGGAKRAGRIGWPRRLRNLPASAPGKRAYVQKMHALYRGEIADFNAAYGTGFDTFDALETAENWRRHTDISNAQEVRDNIAFLQLAVATYYKVARDALRRHDPNHLFLGDKLSGNTDGADTIMPITTQFTDVIFYQMYGQYDLQAHSLDRWSQAADIPIINGDSSYTMITDGLPRPYGPVADSISERADWTAEFFERAFARPEFVGWHYCGIIDAPNLIASKRDRQHSGLLDRFGAPYPELYETVRSCADRMYDIALQQGR